MPIPDPRLLTAEAQLAHLRAQGMAVRRPADARRFLERTGFARFGDYAEAFRDRETGAYREADFERVRRLMELDERLRLHVLRGVQTLEVGLRTGLNAHLSRRHHPHWYADPAVLPRFVPARPAPTEAEPESIPPSTPPTTPLPPQEPPQRTLMPAEDFAARAYAEYLRSREDAASGHRRRHGLTRLPPGWLITELMSFGVWSRVYATLSHDDQDAIAAPFALHRDDLKGWLQDVTVLRNVSAHHARLWNRRFRGGRLFEPDPAAQPLKTHSYREYRPEISLAPRLYAMHRLLLPLGERAWTRELHRLIGAFEPYGLERLGFREGWQARPEWRAGPVSRVNPAARVNP